MKCFQLHGEARVANETKNFDGIYEDHCTEIWLDREQENVIDNASIFCHDFPPLLDFPCMSSSSSSSSSSTPVTVKVMACSSSSSSATSWAVLRSDVEDHNNQYSPHQHDASGASAVTLSSNGSTEIPQPSDQGNSYINRVDCNDVTGNFECIDLIKSNDFFDLSSVFQPVENLTGDFRQRQNFHDQQDHQLPHEMLQINNNGGSTQGGGKKASDDLAMMFLDWLKSNKESISAEDLRNVKIKKATIECAARRLGGGKEAMRQLLKLILEWVRTNHLQKRRIKEVHQEIPKQNPNLICCYTASSPWIPQPPFADPFQPQAIQYKGHDPYVHGAPNIRPRASASDCHILDSYQSRSQSKFTIPTNYNSFPDNTLNPNSSGNPNHYPHPYLPGPGQGVTNGGGERLVRLGSSATKEARKKRMARQRRFLLHHRNHSHSQDSNRNPIEDPHSSRLGNEHGTTVVGQASPSSWFYWSPDVTSSGSPALLSDAPPVHQQQQGWKAEKNLKFLLQKVLKQSDVGNLGRIVLPKKEAETHLPELDARDGISIAMEDIGTSCIWNMRYRFWPNNKSRMYLLENTGDFIKINGLQEGDFIVIYSDVKCGKYLIRGVKVRQPPPKSETKRAGKLQRRQKHVNSSSAVVNGH